MIESVVQDLKHGVRMLVKNPGFTLIAVASIAIGVGANAAMFSLADGLVLRPLQVPIRQAPCHLGRGKDSVCSGKLRRIQGVSTWSVRPWDGVVRGRTVR